MRLRFAAALAAALAGANLPASAQMPEDIQRQRFTVTEGRLPDARIAYRPLQAQAVEAGSFGSGYAMNVKGTLTVEQIAQGRYRMTVMATRLWGKQGTQAFDLALGNVRYLRVEHDAAGKAVLLDPVMQDLPALSPSPQLTQPQWQSFRDRLIESGRDWVPSFAVADAVWALPRDAAIGDVIMSRNTTEMLARRLDVLDALVRGNTSGFYVDLPRGGSLNDEQREVYAGMIRARGLPQTLESDVRIRGMTSHAGRSYILADGTAKLRMGIGVQGDYSITCLFDPVSGWLALQRVSATVRTPTGTEHLGNYWRLQLP